MHGCQNQAWGWGTDDGARVPAFKAAVHQRRLGSDAMVVAQTVWMTLVHHSGSSQKRCLKDYSF